METGGVRLRGPIAELYRYGTKAGLLYDWRFEGWARDWRIEAERYKLDPLIFGERAPGRDVKVRVVVAGHLLFTASGNIWTDYAADGKSHRGLVVKGTHLSWHDEPAALAHAQAQMAPAPSA